MTPDERTAREVEKLMTVAAKQAGLKGEIEVRVIRKKRREKKTNAKHSN